MLLPPNRNRTAFGSQAETPALLLSITGLPGLIEIRQRRTATCSGTQPAIELGFGLPPLFEKAWRARAFLPGLTSHKRRRSVQKNIISPNPTMPAGRRHRRRQPTPSTTRLRRRHTDSMRRARPDRSTTKPTPDRPTSTRPQRQQLNAAGCARAGLPTVNLTQNAKSTQRQTTTGYVTRRVVQGRTRAQSTNTETGMTTTRTTSDRASACCSNKEPMPKKPTMRRLRQPCTNKTAAGATT